MPRWLSLIIFTLLELVLCQEVDLESLIQLRNNYCSGPVPFRYGLTPQRSIAGNELGNWLQEPTDAFRLRLTTITNDPAVLFQMLGSGPWRLYLVTAVTVVCLLLSLAFSVHCVWSATCAKSRAKSYRDCLANDLEAKECNQHRGQKPFYVIAVLLILGLMVPFFLFRLLVATSATTTHAAATRCAAVNAVHQFSFGVDGESPLHSGSEQWSGLLYWHAVFDEVIRQVKGEERENHSLTVRQYARHLAGNISDAVQQAVKVETDLFDKLVTAASKTREEFLHVPDTHHVYLLGELLAMTDARQTIEGMRNSIKNELWTFEDITLLSAGPLRKLDQQVLDLVERGKSLTKQAIEEIQKAVPQMEEILERTESADGWLWTAAIVVLTLMIMLSVSGFLLLLVGMLRLSLRLEEPKLQAPNFIRDADLKEGGPAAPYLMHIPREQLQLACGMRDLSNRTRKLVTLTSAFMTFSLLVVAVLLASASALTALLYTSAQPCGLAEHLLSTGNYDRYPMLMAGARWALERAGFRPPTELLETKRKLEETYDRNEESSDDEREEEEEPKQESPAVQLWWENLVINDLAKPLGTYEGDGDASRLLEQWPVLQDALNVADRWSEKLSTTKINLDVLETLTNASDYLAVLAGLIVADVHGPTEELVTYPEVVMSGLQHRTVKFPDSFVKELKKIFPDFRMFYTTVTGIRDIQNKINEMLKQLDARVLTNANLPMAYCFAVYGLCSEIETESPVIIRGDDGTAPLAAATALIMAEHLKPSEALLWSNALVWAERKVRVINAQPFRTAEGNVLQLEDFVSDTETTEQQQPLTGWTRAMEVLADESEESQAIQNYILKYLVARSLRRHLQKKHLRLSPTSEEFFADAPWASDPVPRSSSLELMTPEPQQAYMNGLVDAMTKGAATWASTLSNSYLRCASEVLEESRNYTSDLFTAVAGASQSAWLHAASAGVPLCSDVLGDLYTLRGVVLALCLSQGLASFVLWSGVRNLRRKVTRCSCGV